MQQDMLILSLKIQLLCTRSDIRWCSLNGREFWIINHVSSRYTWDDILIYILPQISFNQIILVQDECRLRTVNNDFSSYQIVKTEEKMRRFAIWSVQSVRHYKRKPYLTRFAFPIAKKKCYLDFEQSIW